MNNLYSLNDDNNSLDDNHINDNNINVNKITKDIVYSKIGIINIGYTCYINSVIQVLTHSFPFITLFLSRLEKFNIIFLA